MTYDGLEIDMLNVGDADAIIVTRWEDSICTRVLIDGGNSSNYAKLKNFFNSHDISYIDHVVSTHPHDDHAGGLVELLKDTEIHVGQVWMHIPANHVDMIRVTRALESSFGIKRAEIIQKTLDTAMSLIDICERRGIAIYEPFAGKNIGFLTVAGPTAEYYEELLEQFKDSDQIKKSDEVFGLESLANFLLKQEESDGTGSLLENPQTSPENNSSVILATVYDGKKYLFTADAGAQALILAAKAYDLSNCRWMQLPHHGSRRNITKSLIDHFSPQSAFVSANGNKKHPRRAVVNAFKANGTKVYSTHYPSPSSIRQCIGDVPERSGYNSNATPLWEANR